MANGVGFPAVLGVIAGATSGFQAKLPLLVTDSGDGITGLLNVSGSFSTAFPYNTTADAQPQLAASATALVGFNGTSLDRILVRNIGTDAGAAASGALVVQSSPEAAPFPIAPIGQGALFEIPAGSVNGVAIGVFPVGAQGVRMYIAPGQTLTYTIAASQPSGPANVVTFGNPSTATYPIVIDENLSKGQNVYITSPTVQNIGLQARWI